MAFRSVPRPSSPPGAKASTECPSHTRYNVHRLADEHTMHRNHPQTALGIGPLEATPKPRRSFRQEPFFAHNRIPSGHRSTHCSRNGQNRQPDKIVHNASELSPPTAGALIPKDSSPGQTCNRTTGPAPIQTDLCRSHAPRDAPEPDSP